jgi:hypothetical protein
VPDPCEPPWAVRPTWRHWLTKAELEDMRKLRNFYGPDGSWEGAHLGISLSGCRVRAHSARSRRKDARWAAKRGFFVDEKDIIRFDEPTKENVQ